MKYISLALTFFGSLLFTSSALAHEDHALGNGVLHFSYHVVFWSLCALVVYKGYKLLAAKRFERKKHGG